MESQEPKKDRRPLPLVTEMIRIKGDDEWNGGSSVLYEIQEVHMGGSPAPEVSFPELCRGVIWMKPSHVEAISEGIEGPAPRTVRGCRDTWMKSSDFEAIS